MTVQNALDRIKWDTPMKTVENKWQYKTELEVLQKAVDDYYRLLDGMKLLSQLDQLNLRVLLQAKHEAVNT
jgi:hypothetical protein